ncbi:GNAT family N-acetyltransferase [Anabaena sp. PCC 7108]|uniref:GNAT family N-acetyltransferase n=1 Tax=Anabaena sp. PCC 7108 TaxID=163908 RepID=UPI0003476A68|nr:GNAT family N-acetyltransferase [Anabaena sp. PCC 7108]
MSKNFHETIPTIDFEEKQEENKSPLLLPNEAKVITIIYIRLNGKEIGISECVFFNENPGRWHIRHIEIIKDFRWKKYGYGKKLLEETCKRQWSKNPVTITLDPVSQDPNITKEELVKAYQSCGFIQTGPGTRMRRYPPQ